MKRTLCCLLALSCNGDVDPTDPQIPPDPYDVQVGPYDVSVKTTSYGIPHITAADEGSLGYGIGHVWARNHICVIADQIVKVRSERSKYFGDAHLDSDFGWLHLKVRKQAEDAWFTLDQRIRDRIVGTAAGYNEHLATVGADGLPEPCKGAEWVKPVSHIDLLSYYVSLAQWGSGYNLVTVIGNATPPGAQDETGEALEQPPIPPMEILEPVKHPPIGSNGWAIGKDASVNGGGMLLSNTHFPMTGERQWMEMHLTIPGELNIYGVGLVGMPLVAMGFNEHVAWTHTVSNTPRFTSYLLQLGPDRISYEYDGEMREMTATKYTIEVKGADGSTTNRSRTLYESHYGPIWNAPVVGWGGQVMTYRDVNWNNLGTIPTFDGMGRATSLEEFKSAHRDFQGIPWVHTMATDKEGNAFYTDSAATPNISSETWAAYDSFVASNFFAKQFESFGLSIFDGSDSAFEWVEDDAAARPGAVPFDDSPQLQRTDYVSNANQNHWLANPDEPLEGYPRIYGATGVPATPRTRMNHFYLRGLGAEPEIGPDGKWSLDEVETAALSMRASLSELLLDEVVERCKAQTGPIPANIGDGEVSVDLGPTCAVLDNWDGRGNTDSVGAHVFREFLLGGVFPTEDLGDAGTLFKNAFDPADPINTPNGLAEATDESPDTIAVALAEATLRIQKAGLPLDAALGDIQVRKKGTTATPTPGGYYAEGYAAIATWSGRGGDSTLLPGISRGEVVNDTTGLTDEGYVVTNGNSWVMAMEFGAEGPNARAVLTYSQSEDPASPHYVDQTELYATQKMRPILYKEADVAADPNLVEESFSLAAQ